MSTTELPAPPTSCPSPTRRSLVLLLAMGVGLLSFGCAFGEIRLKDPFDRELTLERAQHQYTTLVRFSEFQKARAFVVEDQRDDYARQMKVLDEARFTDFDSEEIELEEGMDKATILVTYTVYSSALPYEVEVEEKQEWSRDGISNTWLVRSTFEGLQKLALN